MSTVATTPRPSPRTAALLSRAVAAEWTRIWTVRTTWWCLLAAAVTMGGFGVLLGLDAASTPDRTQPWPPAWEAGEMALLPGQFALLVLVLLATTSEYATGSITATLQWTSRRGVVLAARALVAPAVAAVAGVVLVLATGLAAWATYPALELPMGAIAGTVGRAVVVLLAGSALTVGAGLALRSTAGALAVVFLAMLVLPFLLPAFSVSWLLVVAEHCPGSAAAALLVGESGMSTARAVGILLAWAAAAMAAGAGSLLRRDAG